MISLIHTPISDSEMPNLLDTKSKGHHATVYVLPSVLSLKLHVVDAKLPSCVSDKLKLSKEFKKLIKPYSFIPGPCCLAASSFTVDLTDYESASSPPSGSNIRVSENTQWQRRSIYTRHGTIYKNIQPICRIKFKVLILITSTSMHISSFD